MKKIYSPFLLALILFMSTPILIVAQEAQETKEKTELPKVSDTIPEQGSYIPDPISEYNEAYYILDTLNANIGLPSDKFNFQTPQSTLEHFVKKARSEDYKQAALAFNMNLFPNETTLEEAAILAEKFYFVINKRVSIDWDNLPDRPDGQIDIATATNEAVAGKPRRSITFGKLGMNGQDAVFRLQRVKVKDEGIFWMLSPNTVENIEQLYEIYGPRKLDRIMPQWSRVNILGVPVWKLLGTLILLFIGYFVYKGSSHLVRKLFLSADKRWMNMVAHKLATPGGLTVGVLFFYLALENLISFGGSFARILYTILLISLIGSITWFVMRFINTLMVYLAENSVGDKTLRADPESRRIMTYVSVARRVLTIIVIAVGLSVILSQFDSLEKLGVSLIASAGLATVVLGVAAQDTLGNVIAGIQIALTRPAKIGDTIEINDEMGFVEDITFTFVVVRTWDEKRMVVPCKELVSSIFLNWSMTNPNQVKPISIFADYSVDVSKVRKKFIDLLEASDKWDKEVDPTLEVVEVTEKSIELRALCSAKDAPTAWELHCELREELVAYVAALEEGKYLTKMRLEKESSSRHKG